MCYNTSMGVDDMVAAVRRALEPFAEISFACLFGSAAIDRLRDDSDVDVAVYFDSGRTLEIETDRRSARETAIQLAVERSTNRNVDLLVLNRAPASVCAAAVRDGVAVLIRDESIHSRYFLAVTNVAMDFRTTEKEFRAIRAGSSSLSETDRSRLQRIVDFVTQEMQDRDAFLAVRLDRYRSDRDLQRNLDRWVEQLINAVIETAKIVLASENRPVPQTYAQILGDLEAMDA
ncbi:MAG: nucleotidyltransferase domain-containing protein, partial [Spirochaetaceae bacterium]